MDTKSHHTESAPFSLPEVQAKPEEAAQGFESGAQNTEERSMSQAVEQNALGSALTGSGQSAQPTVASPLPLADPAGGLIKSIGLAKKIAVTDDLPANDSDLIEKAWVVKAKAIVEQTKNNPYEQTNEFKKIRADYQNKRFKTNPKIDQE